MSSNSEHQRTEHSRRGATVIRLVPPTLAVASVLMGTVLVFVVLDLVGRLLPLFDSKQWGPFSEWALVVVTPLAVVVALAAWQQERQDLLDRGMDAARKAEAAAIAAIESQLAGLVLVAKEGGRGPVLWVENRSTIPITVLGTKDQGDINPTRIYSGGELIMEGSTLSDVVYLERSGLRFDLSLDGISWNASSSQPQNPDS